MSQDKVHSVKKQYESWPYPQIPLMAQVRRESLWQINYEWIAQSLGKEVSSHPKIWIAGCGTFQPYVFSLANPRAEILATDLSEASLKKAKKRCAVYRRRNVRFQPLDLSQSKSFPQEKFDLIECYGVLMSLPNPKEVLQGFADRLNPGGILRLMVYPHYGRQRIFHIQKIAKLLGLGPDSSSSPRILQNLMSHVSESNPLKSTFFDYPDSKNLPGIVDGFLHASDRGFSGEEISRLLDETRFEMGFCYHRPWGQPTHMAKELGLEGLDPGFWLHYLDLWQSLKSNFILTLVKSNAPVAESSKKFQKHPLFDLSEPLGLKYKVRLLKKSILGAKLQSRTHEKGFLQLSPSEFRSLLKGRAETSKAQEVLGRQESCSEPFFKNRVLFPKPSDPWRVGKGLSPNPLYRHLFDAYTFTDDFNRLGGNLPDLKVQLAKWAGLSRPLETEERAWGLTPWTTYQKNEEAIQNWLKNRSDQGEVSISQVKLKNEDEKIAELLRFLRRARGIETPKSVEGLRVLWILLMSHDQLFLEFEQ